jgi:hypothetical protein
MTAREIGDGAGHAHPTGAFRCLKDSGTMSPAGDREATALRPTTDANPSHSSSPHRLSRDCHLATKSALPNNPENAGGGRLRFISGEPAA